MLVLPLVMGNLPFEWANTFAERLPGTGRPVPDLRRQPARHHDGPPHGSPSGAWALAALVGGGLRLLRTDANR